MDELIIGIILAALYFTIGMIIGNLCDLEDDKLVWFAILWPVPVVVTLLFGVFAIIVITWQLIKTLYKTIMKGD